MASVDSSTVSKTCAMFAAFAATGVSAAYVPGTCVEILAANYRPQGLPFIGLEGSVRAFRPDVSLQLVSFGNGKEGWFFKHDVKECARVPLVADRGAVQMVSPFLGRVSAVILEVWRGAPTEECTICRGWLLPPTWSWQERAADLFARYQHVFVGSAILYYPVICGIRSLMKNHNALDLGGANTKAAINYIFWWELALAIFSFIGAMHVVPIIVQEGARPEAICATGQSEDCRSFWVFLLILSKMLACGDAFFAALRKKDVTLLRHYHHIATILYSWYSGIVVFKHNNANTYFAAMDFCIHTVMYSWSAATRRGWKSPQKVKTFVILLQFLQMAFSMLILFVVALGPAAHGCGTWERAEPRGMAACVLVYTSYLVFFGRLLYANAIGSQPENKVNKDVKPSEIEFEM